MRPQWEIKGDKRLMIVEEGADGGCGYAFISDSKRLSEAAQAVWSLGGGWDHVSISFSNRTPTWAEMCRAKEIFFGADEWVVQYHPAEDEYVNCHPYCLHLWRPQAESLPTPPSWMVGPRKGQSLKSAYAEAERALRAYEDAERRGKE